MRCGWCGRGVIVFAAGLGACGAFGAADDPTSDAGPVMPTSFDP